MIPSNSLLRARRALASVLFVLCGAAAASADVSLHQLFTNNMILQQDTLVNVWGEANPGEAIAVTGSWSGQSVETVAGDDGAWSVQLQTPAANQEEITYTVTIQGENTITLKNVAIGEVWIMSGQSNAAITV